MFTVTDGVPTDTEDEIVSGSSGSGGVTWLTSLEFYLSDSRTVTIFRLSPVAYNELLLAYEQVGAFW